MERSSAGGGDAADGNRVPDSQQDSQTTPTRAHEIAHLGSRELDLRTRRLTCSDEVYRIFGLAPQESGATCEGLLQCVHPDDRAAVDDAYWGAARGGRDTFEIEYRIVRSGGEIRYVQERCQHVRDADGHALKSLGIMLDITERRQTEEALRRSEAGLAAAQRLARLGSWEWRIAEDVASWSDETYRIFGLNRATLTDHRHAFLDAVHPDDRSRVDQALSDATNGLRSYDLEYRIRLPNGAVKMIHAQAEVTVGPDGKPVLMRGTVQDITERRQVEDELRASKALADAANAAKDHFMAALSHELRTPLTPVVAALSVLQNSSELPEEMRDTLAMVHRNVQLEVRLIDDLLDVTRIANGKTDLDRQPLRLGEVIARAVEVCRPDVGDRNLEFEIDAAGCCCTVEGDPTRLQQVFWNILRNAIKFTPGDGRVSIRCWCADNTAIAEISDTGVGIEPEALGRIFNAFEQGERSITRQFGGLGLGLTISKMLVELHGGTIEAHSEGKGKGATFRVRLPILADQQGAQTPLAAAPRAAPPLRILLVEDNQDTAKILRLLLTKSGHQVQHASNVARALQIFGNGQFDLLISDLGLPDRSGLDLVRELRAGGSAIPAIALSGYGQDEDLRRSKEAGFAIHLIKPTTPDRLTEAIAAAITR